MNISRRSFLTRTVAGGLSLSILGVDIKPAQAAVTGIEKMKKLRSATETTSICCYCSCGCGLICSTDEKGVLFNIEGDPDHPINEGALCPKGANIMQTSAVNQHRLKDVLYRAPYSNKWEKKDWEWATTRIAEKIKAVRDADFIKTNGQGKTVNRVETIALHGSSNINNEECFMMTSMARALGLVYIDHQARV
ncbi:MAG: Formate dehydrogenase subunit alpha precursor [Syntrophorhabdus sp. PtaU1.Bin050]|jgi:formate dehydrogenase major subunit|nr:MAG: Formate dehydrogenase subunit alpha precursor [Syntrophorhabdus sp. PtaU1.Bin050]